MNKKNKKKIYIIIACFFSLIVIANIIPPYNAFKQLLNANNQEEHLSALRGFKEKVKINNIEECDNSCESKLFFTSFNEIRTTTEKEDNIIYASTLENKKYKINILNANFLKGATNQHFFKKMVVEIAGEQFTFNELEMRNSQFNLAGNFLNNNTFSSDEVEGVITSININKEALSKLENKLKEKKRKVLFQQQLDEKFIKLPDGKLRYYGYKHKDNNINYETVEYMCSTKGGHVLSNHLKTYFITAGKDDPFKELAKNNKNIGYSKISYDKERKECTAIFPINGRFDGREYERYFFAFLRGWEKEGQKFRLEYISIK